ncbi:MAG TPA: hypothetical protein VIL94_10685, partial [Acidothermaceae bacterium]
TLGDSDAAASRRPAIGAESTAPLWTIGDQLLAAGLLPPDFGFDPFAAGFGVAGLPALVVEGVAGVVALVDVDSEPDDGAAAAAPVDAVDGELSAAVAEPSEEELSDDDEPAPTFARSRLSLR